MDDTSGCGVGVVFVVVVVVVGGASGVGVVVVVDGFIGAFFVGVAVGVLWMSSTAHSMLNGRSLLPASNRHDDGDNTLVR